MSVTERERTAPTEEELDELLGMLMAANEAGQLKSLTFMLEDDRGNHMVDFRGSHEFTELACREARNRIAHAVVGKHPAIAQAIHATNGPALVRVN